MPLLSEIPETLDAVPIPAGQETPAVMASLSDIDEMTNTHRVSRNDFDLASLSYTEAEAKALKSKGKIGWVEQFTRTKLLEKTPGIGMVAGAYEALVIKSAISRLQKDDYKGNTAQKNQDIKVARDAIRYASEEQIRGRTTWAQIVDGATELPAYMIEFAASMLVGAGPAATAGRAVLKAGVRGLENQALKRAIFGTTKAATRAVVGGSIVGSVRIPGGALENEIKLNLVPTERGLQLNEQMQSAPVSSFLKAWGGYVTEMFGEQLGSLVINPAFKAMGASKVVAPVVEKISALYKRLHPSQALTPILTKAGWDGFISEIGEEVLTNELQAVFNIEDFGATGGNMLDRMIAAIPDGEEFAVMVGVLAMPGATHLTFQGGMSAVAAVQQAKHNMDIKRDIAAGKAPDMAILGKEAAWEDIIESAVGEAISPLPQPELTKEQMGDIRVAQRTGEVQFGESKPVPERPVLDEIKQSREYQQADEDTKMELLIRGRTADLDRQRTAIEDRMGRLEVEIDNLNKIGRPDVAILEGKQAELQDLSKQLMSVHAQIADTIDATAEEMMPEKVYLPGTALEVLRKKAREVGARMERARVETVFRNREASSEERRIALVKYLQARLPGKDNAALRDRYALRAVKGMTEAALQKTFAEIEGLRETVLAKQLRTRAEGVIEKMKATIENGVKTGRFKDVSLQRMAQEVIGATTRAKSEVEQVLRDTTAEIERMIEDGRGETPEADLLRYRAMMNYLVGGLEARSATQLETVIQTLTKELASFKMGRDVVTALRDAQRKVLKEAVLAEISKGTRSKKGFVNKALKAGTSVVQKVFSYAALPLAGHFDHFSSAKPDSAIRKFIVEPLEKISRNKAALRMRMERPIREAIARIYGVPTISNDGLYFKFISDRMSVAPTDKEDTKPFIQTVVLNNGKTKNFKMSRMDVQYWYALAYQEEGVIDPMAWEVLTGENQLDAIRQQVEQEAPEDMSEEEIEARIQERAAAEIRGNAVPSDALQRMFDTLTEKDKRFAYEIRKIMTSFWDMINPVYARATGIDMTQIESYMPWIRETGVQNEAEQMFKWAAMIEAHTTPFPSSTKERMKTSSAPFAQKSLMEVFLGFTTSMSHWLGTYDVTSRAQWMLRDGDIRQAMNAATDGVWNEVRERWEDGDFVRNMDYHLKGIVSQSRSDQSVAMPFMDLMRRMFSRAQLADLKQAPMQLSSGAAAVIEVGHRKFATGLMSFLSNPRAAIALLERAPSLSYRYQNLVLELKEVADLVEKQRGKWGNNLLPDHYAYFATQLGDRGAILVGGWTVFKAKFEETKDIEAAYKAFDKFVFTLQQSALREQQAVIGTGYNRYIFQFVSAQAQYARYYYKVWGDMLKNPNSDTIKQWARSMVVFHLYLPMGRYWASTAFLPPTDDDEEKAKQGIRRNMELLQGPFSGLWILGHAVDFLAGTLAQIEATKQGISHTGIDPFGVKPPIFEEMDKTRTKLTKAIRLALDEDADIEDIIDAAFEAGKKTAGLTMGVPREITDVVEGLYNYSTGDWVAADIPGLLYGHSTELLEIQRSKL